MGLAGFVVLFTILLFSIILSYYVWKSGEQTPPSKTIIEIKSERLKDELSELEIVKTHNIKTHVMKNAFSFEHYCVGISIESKCLVIYKPIEHATDDIYIEIIDFSNIIGCEIIEDNETIQKGGVGRAIVGGALAGGVGAIVGATTRRTIGVVNSLSIRILLNDILNPCFEIKVIDSEIKRDSFVYKELHQVLQEIYSTIMAIENDNKNETTIEQLNSNTNFQPITINVTEEIRKYKQLLDDGIITQEEFDAKKKQLLGL